MKLKKIFKSKINKEDKTIENQRENVGLVVLNTKLAL